MKKADCQRIDSLELWCWRLWRVLWTAKFANQSIAKEVNPEISLGGLMLKLKLQYFGHLMQRAYSLEKPWCWEKLKAGGEADNRGWDGWMASLTDSMDKSSSKLRRLVTDREAWHAGVHQAAESDMTERLNWTELILLEDSFSFLKTFWLILLS